MSRHALALAAFLSLFITATSNASTIVDTGVPDPWPDAAGDPVLTLGVAMMARFTVLEHSQITDALGHLSSASAGGTFTVALYGDGAGAPGAELFAAAASAPDVTFDLVGNAIPDWRGVSGVDWKVGPGAYWVSFEVRPGDTFSGFAANPAPHPLALEGIGGDGGFIPMALALGVRIDAVPVPVPVPGAGWLLVGALPLLSLRRPAQALA